MPIIRHTQPYTDTSSKLKTFQNFYVAPGNQHDPENKEVKFLVLRYNDERSSALCKQIEEMARSNGGIYIQDENAIKRGFSSSYRTQLFHENCRCRLVIKPRFMGNVIDDLSFSLAAGNSSLSNAAVYRGKRELAEDLMDDYESESYKQRVYNVMSINLSRQHNKHDRRKIKTNRPNSSVSSRYKTRMLMNQLRRELEKTV